MAENVVVSDDSVEVTDKDGNSTTLKREDTKDADKKAGSVKVKKTVKETGKKEKTDAPALVPVAFSEAGETSTWSFSSGGYAVIEVHCPPAAKEGETEKKPTIHVSVNNPHVEAKKELKDHKEQKEKIAELKKMFGPFKK